MGGTVFSTDGAFAARKTDGSVVTWGYRLNGGDSSAVALELASGVSMIYSASFAFAAVKTDESVLTRRSARNGFNSDKWARSIALGIPSASATPPTTTSTEAPTRSPRRLREAPKTA